MKHRVFLCIFLFSLGLQLLFAAPQMWQNELAIRQGMNINWTQTTAANPDGSMIIVWSDTRFGERDLWAQKVDCEGNFLWNCGNPLLITSGSNLQINPIIIPTTDNCLVIAWISTYYPSEDPVLAQKINQNGEALWQENGIVISEDMDFRDPLYGCSDNAGGVYLAWNAYENDSANIYAAHILASGCKTWDPNGIQLTDSIIDRNLSCMIADGAGGFIFGYLGRNNYQRDLYLNRILFNGSSAWNGAIVVSDAVRDQDQAVIASDGTGSFIIAWRDNRELNSHKIFAHRINRDGQFLWNEPILVSTGLTTYSQNLPQITGASDSGVIVAWSDFRDGYEHSRLYAQKISPNGDLVWNSEGVPLSQSQSDQQNPRLTNDDAGGCYFVWEDTRNGGYYIRDIYAQHITNSGTTLWNDYGCCICNNSSDQFASSIQRASDKLLISWADYRTGSCDIYYQALSHTGNPLLEQNGKLVCRGMDGDAIDPILLKQSNNAVLVWKDSRQYYFGYRIYFQIVTPEHSLLLPANGKPITTYTGHDQSNFSATMVSDNQIAVTWVEDTGDSSKVYAQLLSPTGDYLWGDTGIAVAQYSSMYQRDPKISFENGYIYIGWSDLEMNGSDYNVYRVKGQKFDIAGNPLWGANGKLISEDHIHLNPPECLMQQLVNRYFIWISVDRLYVKLVDTDGNTVPGWNPEGKPAANYTDDFYIEIYPKAAAENDGLVLTWEDLRGDFIGSIYAQKFNSDGSYAWDPSGVIIKESDSEQNQASIFVADGIYIPWCDYLSGFYYNAAIQKLSLNGEYAWDSQGTYIAQQTDNQSDPVIAALDDQNLLIAWAESQNNQRDIYVKRFNPNGEFQDADAEFPVCITQNCQYSPQMVSAGNDKVYIAWTDDRSSGSNSIDGLYMQLLDYSLVANHDVTTTAPIAALYDNYPNPFNPETTIQFSLPHAGKAKLEVFNIKGQMVRTLVDNALDAGIHKITWNGKNQDNRTVGSGVYFYRLTTCNQSMTKKMILMK